MGTNIASHEPSRHLFLGIADGAERLANAIEGTEFFEALFALDYAFHPGSAGFDYFVPNIDRIKVDLNGPYIYDSNFFLPKHLKPHVVLISKVYHDLARECDAWRYRKGISVENRSNLNGYVGMWLRVGPKTQEMIKVSVAAIRTYFLKVHLTVLSHGQ